MNYYKRLTRLPEIVGHRFDKTLRLETPDTHLIQRHFCGEIRVILPAVDLANGRACQPFQVVGISTRPFELYDHTEYMVN